MNGIYRNFSSKENSQVFGNLLSTLTVGSKETYVLHSCTDYGKFAVALSNYTAVVYDAYNNETADFVHDNVITGIKFSGRDPTLLFTSSIDGKINLWDSRCEEPVQTFLENSSGALKPLLCFDYNSDESFVCAGTEMIREDSFILFWDRRTSKCLGGYWDSHTDDISQVRFHPSEKSHMASASMDGLINIYDLNKGTEDEAILNTLNVESGISKISWMNPDVISCVTSLEEYQLWSVNEPSPILSLTREDLSNSSQYKVDSVIDSLKIEDFWYLATGNYNGSVHLWCIGDKSVKPAACLSEGHTDVVRTLCYNSEAGMIFTGGEDGCVSQWKVPCKNDYEDID